MLLVEYGAKVDAWEQFAIYVPSHEAAIMGNLVVELLLDHGADANTQLNNCNISWKTSGRGSLTRGRLDPRAQNEEGKKAFRLASEEYEDEIARLPSKCTGEGM
jgi:ankyrin repeat protein